MTQPLMFEAPLAGSTTTERLQTRAATVLVVMILVIAGGAQMGLLWTAGVLFCTVAALVTLRRQRLEID